MGQSLPRLRCLSYHITNGSDTAQDSKRGTAQVA